MSSEMVSKSSQLTISDDLSYLRLQILDKRLILIDKKLELMSKMFKATNIDCLIRNLKTDSNTNYFIHRPNLDQLLLNKVLRPTNGAKFIVLKGFKDSGKTVSAINLANKLLNEHNFKYKFLDCDFDLEEQFLDILENDNNIYNTHRDLIIEIFVNKTICEKSNILLISDNATKSQNIKEILVKLPAIIKIVIATSFLDFKITSMSRNSEQIIFDRFNEKQTRMFLDKNCQTEYLLNLNKDQFNELVKILMQKGFLLLCRYFQFLSIYYFKVH
jgi:hypothetical protein